MRYAFHGKIRATGQVVDGFVEASSSAEAIDRLADQGIIGVQTVRPDPLPPRNAILLSGQQPGQPAPQLESAMAAPDLVLTQLVDKLTTLVGHVENLLSRPAHAMPQRPARANLKLRSERHPSEAQTSVLSAIFETNMDLRKSLIKLASVTAAVAPAPTADESSGTETAALDNSIRDVAARDPSPREPLHNHSGNGNGTGNNGHSHDLTAHPAAPRDLPDLEIAAQSVA